MTSPFNPAALIELRGSAQLTQAELAERIGVAVWTVGAWERGLQRPAAPRLPEIAAALGCAVEELMIDAELTPQALRHRAGLSLAQLAEKASVPFSTVAGVERGRYVPTEAAAIAAALGVTTDEFVAACVYRQELADERGR